MVDFRCSSYYQPCVAGACCYQLCKGNIVALHIDPAIDDVSKCKSNIVALHFRSGEWILYTVQRYQLDFIFV